MTIQPWTGRDLPQPENRLNLASNAPFYLMHSPMQWDFEGGQWLPAFSTLSERPGVNGVYHTKWGGDSTEARMHFADLGYTILDYKQMGYVARHPCVGGHFYTTIFAEPKQIAGKVFWDHDKEAYNEWRLSLITDGIIDPPDKDVLSLHIDKFRRTVERNLKDQHIPEKKARLIVLQKRLEAMKKAKDKLFQKDD